MQLTGVGICEQRRQGQQNFRDGKRWAPLVLQDVQADASIRVYVGMINPCCELELGRLRQAEASRQKTGRPEARGGFTTHAGTSGSKGDEGRLTAVVAGMRFRVKSP